MRNIIWLASYPKSGNNWFRIFLSNLLNEKEDPTDINNITSTHGIASARHIYEEITPLVYKNKTMKDFFRELLSDSPRFIPGDLTV